MTEQDWSDPDLHSIGMLLPGRATDEIDTRGRSYAGDSLLILLNAGTRSRSYTLPLMELAGLWVEELNTVQPGPWGRVIRNEVVSLTAHSTLAAAAPRTSLPVSGSTLGSTYRLQLHGLGPGRRSPLVPYLDDLGIETVYLSPILAAAPGSTHGYDVVDPTRIDPALGSDEDLDALLDALASRGMHAPARHRPEPHGGRPRQCLVVGRAATRVRIRRQRTSSTSTGAMSTGRWSCRRSAVRSRRCWRTVRVPRESDTLRVDGQPFPVAPGTSGVLSRGGSGASSTTARPTGERARRRGTTGDSSTSEP